MIKKTRLSARLQLVFDNLIEGNDVWDFCCDHGYLGAAAYKSKQFKNIYFVDPVPAIIESLKSRFNTFVFQKENRSQVHFVTKHGQDIDQVVDGTASIIGVGAFVIGEILTGLSAKELLKAQRLILGPHRDTDKLLELMRTNTLFKNYELVSQLEIIEDKRVRVFLIYNLK